MHAAKALVSSPLHNQIYPKDKPIDLTLTAGRKWMTKSRETSGRRQSKRFRPHSDIKRKEAISMRARPIFLHQVPDDLLDIWDKTGITGETRRTVSGMLGISLRGRHLPRKFEQKLKTPFRREWRLFFGSRERVGWKGECRPVDFELVNV